MSIGLSVGWWWLIGGLLAGGGIATGLMWRVWRQRLESERAQAKAEQAKLETRCQTWEEFAGCASPLLPVLVEQLKAVASQTESAALELCARFQRISQRAQEQAQRTAKLLSGAGSGETGAAVTVETVLAETEQTLGKFLQDVMTTSEVTRNVATVMRDRCFWCSVSDTVSESIL